MPRRAHVYKRKLADHEGLGDGPRRRDAKIFCEVDQQGADADASNVRP